MNAMTGSADAVHAVGEAAVERPCIDLEGSKVCAEVGKDGVLVVRVYPAGDTPTAVYVDQDLVAGSEIAMTSGPAGRHRKPVKG